MVAGGSGQRRPAQDRLDALALIECLPRTGPTAIVEHRALAARLFAETPGRSDAGRVIRLYQLAFARKPQPVELQAGLEFLRGQTGLIRQRIARGEPVAALADPPKGLDPVQAAAWVDYCLATLNLNEFVYVK